MQSVDPATRERGPGMFVMECSVAILFLAFGALVIWGSRRVGIGWGMEGPRAGYFPFYIGLLICISSAVTLAQAVLNRADRQGMTFATWDQLRQVSAVLVPSLVYVVVIPYLGIYVCTAGFIGWFMGRIGHYGPTRIVPVAVLVPVLTFMVFEFWFKVPLPKGPLEVLLGF